MPDFSRILGAFRKREHAVLAILPLDSESDDALHRGWHLALIEILERASDLTLLGPESAIAFSAEQAKTDSEDTPGGVTAVLTCTVESSGDLWAGTATLADVSGEHKLWNHDWSGPQEEIFSVYFDIAQGVTSSLGATIPLVEAGLLHREPTTDLVAWRSCLEGMLALGSPGERELRAATDAFQAAIARDNLLAAAWAGAAECYRVADERHIKLDAPDPIQAAHEAGTRAAELNATLPSALVALAWEAMRAWDLNSASDLLSDAIEAAPGHAQAHRAMARLATLRGDLSTAIKSANRAVALEPFSADIVNESGLPHALRGYPEQAKARSSSVVHRDPEHFMAYFHLGRYSEQLGRTGEAVTYHRAAAELSGRAPYLTAFLGLVLVLVGDRNEAEDIANDLERKARRGSSIATCLGALLIRLGRVDEGLAWLESALEAKEELLLLIDTPWLPLPEVRDTKRFRSLCARLPETRER